MIEAFQEGKLNQSGSESVLHPALPCSFFGLCRVGFGLEFSRPLLPAPSRPPRPTLRSRYSPPSPRVFRTFSCSSRGCEVRRRPATDSCDRPRREVRDVTSAVDETRRTRFSNRTKRPNRRTGRKWQTVSFFMWAKVSKA